MPFDRRVWQECEALTAAGYAVTVICPQGQSQDREPFEVIGDVEIHRYQLRSARRFHGYLREYATALFRTWQLARRTARNGSFAVVQACNPPDLLFLAVLPLRRRGARFIFDHHDLVPELYLSRFGRGRDAGHRATLLFERVAFALAHVVIATNDSYRRVALTRGSKRPEDVFVVRSGPARDRFVPVSPAEELKRGKPHLLAYLGVMGPQDGVDYALRALSRLREIRQDWHAIFVGSGDVFDEMTSLAAELRLDGSVEFTGRVSNAELVRILSTADIGLAPDPKNPLNDVSTMNKIVEYMAMGLPVVSFDLVEARVSAAGAALYARPNDESDFAAQIASLLDHPERREQMAELGRRRAHGELSWDYSAKQLLRAYARALEPRANGGSREISA